MRGSVARTHTKRILSKVVLIRIKAFEIIKGYIDPEKITEVNSLMTRILVYSAIKINANRPLLYSILNPDTSSDSPSAKSNGVRFVSARLVINHKYEIGIIIKNSQEYCSKVIFVMSSEWIINRAVIKIRDILTSYEIVWATPRNAPNNAYFELEHHPAIKVA